MYIFFFHRDQKEVGTTWDIRTCQNYSVKNKAEQVFHSF